jgi:hypothetical protein
MRVGPVREVEAGIEASIDVDGTIHRVTYESSAIAGSHYSDALFAAALIPAMGADAALCVDEPISPRLLAASPTIQDIIRNWEQRYPVYSRYRRVEVRAEGRSRVAPEAVATRPAGTFFSGGVDSFYTALRHASEVGSLIFVQGFDFAVTDTETKTLVTERIRAAAEGLGKPLILVSTDLRKFSDRYAFWEQYHGAALASVALLLSALLSKVFIAATHTYAHVSPLGSHPLLDPLWASEELDIVHDGLEASRLDKLAFLSSHSAARAHLHVCVRNERGAYNCGACEKCLRTMVSLEALGVLGDFATFPDRIDLGVLRKANIPPDSYTWQATLALLDLRGGNDALRRLLRGRLYSRTQLGIREARRLAHRAAAVTRGRG